MCKTHADISCLISLDCHLMPGVRGLLMKAGKRGTLLELERRDVLESWSCFREDVVLCGFQTGFVLLQVLCWDVRDAEHTSTHTTTHTKLMSQHIIGHQSLKKAL